MADKTALQEASQALFCAVADYLGEREVAKNFDIKKFPTYKDFYTNYPVSSQIGKNINLIIPEAYKSQVRTPVSLKEIESFLKSSDEWYKSSLLIAKKLVTDIQEINGNFTKIKKIRWSDVFYARGDSTIMKNIEKMFLSANKILDESNNPKLLPFGDINRWNPADIYFASNAAEKKIVENARNPKITFAELNMLLIKLIDSGDLLPLSLKMAEKEVILKKVNFDRSKTQKELGEYFLRDIDVRDRYIRFYLDNGKSEMRFRHDPSTPAYKGEIILRTARGGSVSGEQIPKTIGIHDKTFANKFSAEFKKQKDLFAKRKKEIEPIKSKDRKKYDEIREKYSKDLTDVINKMLADYFKNLKKTPKGKKTADNIMRSFIEYASSSAEHSGRFVIAKSN